MSGKSLIDQIKHYQKDIERCPDNSERMIRCIQKLYTLPVKVEHLQETGVGKSVNSLRKYKGEVGDAAKALVAKWKAMVAAEESSDEANEVSSNQPQVNEVPISPPSHVINTVKIEKKINHESSRDKGSKNKNSDSKHHSNNKTSNNSDKMHHSSSKKSDQLHATSSNDKIRDKVSNSTLKNKSSSSECLDKFSDIKCNVKSSHKRSHSYSSDHLSDKKNSSHKTHKDNSDRKNKTDLAETPPHKKHKKHHSHSRNHSSSSRKEVKSESEEESSNSDESEPNVSSDNNPNSQSEVESNDSKNSNSDAESNSSSSSDYQHRSNHKSSHHRHSSHSKEKSIIDAKAKHKDNKSRHKESDKTKGKSSESKKHDKHSKNMNVSPDYKELIEENERRIKKEKEEFTVPKYVPTAISKPIKKERSEDDSIDCVSGASFADALLGMDNYSDQKKKKKPASSSNRKSSSVSTSSHPLSSHTEKYKTGSGLKPSSSNSKTIDELVEAPELLSKKIKLEALDLDISLPEINPNYKPLPHIPEKKTLKPVFDEDTMFSHMAAKNQRTKVFSGNKVYQDTVPSLYSLCIQVLFENVEAIEYTGGVPFNLLKPLLEKVNADQLYVLEHFNPYLIEDTDELWKFHSNKDFRSEKRQDMESWRDLYLRCLEERERKLKALTANICQSMAKSTPVRQAKLAYVDSVVKPPRNVARKQAKYGTGDSTSSSKNLTKHEIVSKAIVGGNTPGVSAKDVVPTPSPVARAAMHHPTSALVKKKKAPLMQKALQVMKGTRYKR